MQQEITTAEKGSSEKNWHSPAISIILENLNTSAYGLQSDEADKRLKEHGPNKLPENETPSALKRFLMHFQIVLTYVMPAAAAREMGREK